MNKLTALGVVLLFILAPLLVHGQTYRHESFNAQSGLISNHIADVCQDDEGILWISTSRGISTYDGLNFQSLIDSAGRFPVSTLSRIKSISPDIIVTAGLNTHSDFVATFRKGGKWNRLSIPDSSSTLKERLWDAAVDGDEFVFKYVSNGQLFSYTSLSNSWISIPLPESIQISKLFIRNKIAWLLTRDGVFREHQQGWMEVGPFTHGRKKLIPVDMVFDNQDSIPSWMLGNGWVAQLKDKSIRYTSIPSRSANPRFSELKRSEQGLLFFKSNHFLYWYHMQSGTWQSFLLSDDDANPSDSKLMADREGGLWVTSYRGLHHVPNFRFKTYPKAGGLLNRDVSLIKELSEREYFLGYENGYAILKADSIVFRKEVHEKKQAYFRPLNAATDRNGKVYIAAQDYGVGILLTDYTMKWLPGNYEKMVLVSFLKDTLWAMDREGSLYFLKGNQLIKHSFVDEYPRYISLTPEGHFQICTIDGFRWVKGQKVNSLVHKGNLNLGNIYCSFRYKGLEYFGTEAGLAVLSNGVLEIGSLLGVHIERPLYTALVAKSQVWLGTDNGIYSIGDSAVTHYNESDGLLGWEINRGSFILDRNGRLVVGTNKGISIFDPIQSESKSLRFQPKIKEIHVIDGDATTSALDLPVSQSEISFVLQAISFTGQPLSFRYRMSGLQDEWLTHSISEKQRVTYRRLPPGKFSFEFQARLGDSAWSDSVSSSEILVHGPFYQTIPFYALMLFLAVVLGYGIQWTISNKRSRQALQAEIRERVLEVKNTETKLHLALQNSRMGAWIYDIQNDRIEYSNEFNQVLGIETTMPLRKSTYLSYVHEEDRHRVIAAINNSVVNKTPYEMEARIRLGNGTFHWLSIKGKATYDAGGIPTYLSGTMADISKAKAQELDRERVISELKRINDELDHFIYSVSHDLSAPIKSIKGLINLARMESLTEPVLNYLELIHKSVSRQDNFIREIVEYGRNARLPLTFERLDIIQLIDGIVEDIKFSELPARSKVVVNIDSMSKYVDCDKVRMKIILNNLLSNAIKFKSKFAASHEVIISLARDDGHFSLSIRDNGIGIDEKHFPKLFSMFYRATDQQPGSGIGLYIANEAAKKMGCRIEVKSQLDKGSIFTLVCSKQII